ncbi:MAG: nucleotidyltransferase domain-containing protein [Lachnospiraceae bacterium]|nr:nucleotidyltransferase domain-containing protein [Lachnospiraceae bacterium]
MAEEWRWDFVEDKKVMLQMFANDVIRCMGDTVKRIILYGSYARGDYTSYSDIDIMILTSLDDDGIRRIEDQISEIAFNYEMSQAVVISVNIKNIEHFNYWLGALPYYDNVEKEGIVLAG